MIDSHVHIGQFREIYFEFDTVFDVIFNCGKIDKIVYSSTSSCKPKVQYDFVRNEIEKALQKYPAEVASPLFWVVPDYVNQRISVGKTMTDLPYTGFKLHPYGNDWDFENNMEQTDIIHAVFDYADRRDMTVLIHTGESGVDRPGRFERFFGEYENAKVILAHCRPAGETIEIMQKYKNVYGDTAFVPKSTINAVKAAGLENRLIFGTDFPITHYYCGEGKSLGEQYKQDIGILLQP
jgi:predicted TIM-barrel fold metal-dependent hydrolase